MSTPVAGSLSVTPLYASAADVLVLWDDVNATWRSLPSVSNPMSVAQGGTGQTTLTANAVLVGNGTGPITASAITSDNGATLRVSTNQVIGNAVTSPPSHALIINNAASTPQPAPANTFLMASNEAAQTNAVLDNYGTAGGPNLYLRKARGTAAAPTAVQAGDTIGNVQFFARGATGYSPGSAFVSGIAAENITDTAQGGQLSLGTITVGTTTQVNRVNVRSGVVIGNPAADPGQGGLVLNANAAAPQPPTGGTILQLANIDGTPTRATLDSYGSFSLLTLRRANGTAAAVTAIANGDTVGTVQVQGYDGGGFGAATNINSVATQAWAAGTARGTALAFQTTANGTTATAEAMRIDQNGNVGIGTTGPGAKLHVSGPDSSNLLYVSGGSKAIRIGASSTTASIDCVDMPVTSLQPLSVGGSIVLLTTNGTERMRIDNTGNVGIGTTAPGSKLTVVGGSVQNRGNAAAGAYNLIVDSGPTGADSSTSMVLFRDFTAAASVGAINRTGTNSVAYATTSDARLKADIVESKRGLDALMAIKVSDYKMGKTASQGLLAQDVAKVYPEAVHEGGKDPNLEPWMIDYGRMTPLLIKAVQDLAAKVAALESGLGSRR